MSKTRVFVYGTLKKGNSQRGLDLWGDGVEFVGNALTAKPVYSLYDLGAFPAVSINGKSHILGEVWAIDTRIMNDLDNIEGYPAFYKRTQINTTLGSAWIYHVPDIESYNATYVEPSTNRIASWSNR
jgi:gamma-glutamylcyclotransferase (GGCT)/AIG2-like uncharacterized protein YtfP